MKKVVGAMLAFGVAFATVAGVGVARAETAPRAAVAARVGKHAVSEAVTAKLETVKALHRQAAEVLGQVKEQAQANEQLWSQIRSARADGQTLRSSFKESHQAALSDLKALLDRAKELYAKEMAARAAKDRAALEALKPQLEALKAEMAQSREAHRGDKALAESLKAEMKANQEALAPLKALRDQINAAAGDLKALRQQAAEAETQARQGVKSGDEAAALGALDKVISLEQQAIAKAQQMQQLEQQLGQALQQYTSRHPQQ